MKDWMKNWGGAAVVHAHVEDDNHTEQPLYAPTNADMARYELQALGGYDANGSPTNEYPRREA